MYSEETAFERARFCKPRSILVFCTGSVLFLFAAYQFYTSAPQHNKTTAKSHPTGSTTPACEIWPGWRTFAPNSVSANDSALSSFRLGTPNVMSEMSSQGCTPAKERLGPFGHSSGESQREHPPWSTVRWGQLQSSCANHFYGSERADPAIVDVRASLEVSNSSSPTHMGCVSIFR